jgi:release factor glutamine methyltransferase
VSTIGELRSRYRALAMQEQVDPRDIDLLLGDALSRPLSYLIAHGEEAIGALEEASFLRLVERRFTGEPVQYIRGFAEFFGREFRVDHRVLIPRPETELLVESALEAAPPRAAVLDVGTGSGCIAATLALERRDLRVTAIDRSPNALLVARSNAIRLRAPVRFTAGDLLGPFATSFDVIVSNPPYISLGEYRQLQREVLRFEPPDALVAGDDGLLVIERLMIEAQEQLADGGTLLMEVGFGQEPAVRNLAAMHGWRILDFRRDLAAIPRVVILGRLE